MGWSESTVRTDTRNSVCGCVWIPKEAEASFPKGSTHGTERLGCRDFLKDRVDPWLLLWLRGLRLGLVRVECGRGHNFPSRNAKCTDQLHEWTLVTSDPGRGDAPGEDAATGLGTRPPVQEKPHLNKQGGRLTSVG